MKKIILLVSGKIISTLVSIIMISLSWWTTSFIGFLFCLIVGAMFLILAEYLNQKIRGLKE